MSRVVAVPISMIFHVQLVAAEAVYFGSGGFVRDIMEWNSGKMISCIKGYLLPTHSQPNHPRRKVLDCKQKR